jgi:hypothetical protein
MNVDLMSYSMLQLAENDQQALLDPEILMATANQTFGIFFKHFAYFNLAEQLGGYVYDTPILDRRTSGWVGAYGGLVNATLSTLVDELRMSTAAAILSMTILAFLIVVTIIIYATNRKEYKAMPRDVDTLASIFGWVYASKRLLEWAAIEPQDGPDINPTRPATLQKARMGHFKDSDGNEHWGIEIVDEYLVESMPGSERKDASRDTVSGIESIELQPMKHPDPHDDGEGTNQGARQKLLGSSDSEQ